MPICGLRSSAGQSASVVDVIGGTEQLPHAPKFQLVGYLSSCRKIFVEKTSTGRYFYLKITHNLSEPSPDPTAVGKGSTTPLVSFLYYII